MSIAAAWPKEVGDTCGNVFGNSLRAFDPPIPATAHVLEIGCAEFDALRFAVQSWPEMTFTGIDWRTTTPKATETRIKGDVMAHYFAPLSFDWIFSISAIEHIGLGHYQGDPKREAGDSVAMLNAYRWLKPGGWMYFDVPWNVGPNEYQVVGTSHRVYDDFRLQHRLVGTFRTRWAGVYSKNGEVVTEPKPLKGGESFYYKAMWLQKV